MRGKYRSSTLKTSSDRKCGILMFLAKLADSLLLICEKRHLTYERAAELCGCSAKHFGNIIRRKANPSLALFERMCAAFDLTPNQLLGVSPISFENDSRSPMPVTEIVHLAWGKEITCFPVCPRCGISLEREYQAYCDRCGQCLSWRDFSRALPKH